MEWQATLAAYLGELALSSGMGGGRQGFPYKKDGGACRKFWTEPLRGAKILICRRGLNFFAPERYQF